MSEKEPLINVSIIWVKVLKKEKKLQFKLKKNTSISSHLFRAILNSLNKKGIDIDLLLENLGISSEIYSNPDYRIDANLIRRFWEEASPMVEDDYIGLYLGTSISMTEFGLPGMFFLYSPTIKIAIEKIIKYEVLVSGFLKMKIIPQPHNRERIVLEVNHNHPQGQHVILTQTVLLTQTIKQIAGMSHNPEKVFFSIPSPNDTSRFNAIFNCTINFNQKINAIEFKADTLNQPIIHRDAKILENIEGLATNNLNELVRKNCLSEKIYSIFQKEIYSSNQVPSLSEIAQLFNVSGRTLQRKLKQESSSYGEILQKLRKDEALKLLKDKKLNINEIAWFLGYAEPSSFVMQFKKWTGNPPSSFRS